MAPLAPTVGTVETGIRGDMGQRRDQAADEIEGEEAPVPHGVFHVVPEHPEVEHVGDQVHPSAVEKRCGHQVATGGTSISSGSS